MRNLRGSRNVKGMLNSPAYVQTAAVFNPFVYKARRIVVADVLVPFHFSGNGVLTAERVRLSFVKSEARQKFGNISVVKILRTVVIYCQAVSGFLPTFAEGCI